ncbi:MAG: histidine kinase N-terminal 7TM domain-containing protein [Anaerolineales bacterium]|nr:histidine kinase N-terminal 7TM domain-containing protein [Anaerolineales bacterium]
MSLHIVILLLSAGTAAIISLVSLRRRTTPGATSMIVFAMALAIWAISDVLYHQWSVPQNGLFLLSLASLGATILPTTLFAFALEYSNHGNCLNWRLLALLAVEPALFQVLLWSEARHGLFFAGNGTETSLASLSNGPFFQINTLYTFSLLLTAIIFMVQAFNHRPGAYRLQSGTILIGMLVPLLTDIICLAGFNPVPDLALTPLAYTVTGLTLSYALARYRLLDLIPIPRETVVEGMKDGWMVLDTQNRIVDLNPAAEAVVGLPRHKLLGQPAEKNLRDWPNLLERSVVDMKALDVVRSVNIQDEWRSLNLRAHPLTDRDGKLLGHVVVWRDITEHRKTEEARQRARDEMFILLRAIYGAASRAQNIYDFLTAAIYQIAYTFQGQSCIIFLEDRSGNKSETGRLLLAAHHGLPAENVDSISSGLKESDSVAWVLEHKELLLIPDIQTDPRLPKSMLPAGEASLLIIPMLTEGQLLGVLALVRKKGLAYRTDEIARLTALTEEIASFISSDRQRQLAIALAERQRLVRDLHDSVTQKLYGLVTITEAAQAGLDAGSKAGLEVVPAQIFSRIGEHARQALKEMRLFLFELQPINLESEGLVTILNQRLVAVEGRADIKARLLADDNISLPLEKELALYYIAQEALNNILRHAAAKSVNIRLKQGRINVLLEIEDDGGGFDPRVVDHGGMGLRNMRERVSQIGGKIKIVSTPGKGTRITVTVKNDRLSTVRQKRR